MAIHAVIDYLCEGLPVAQGVMFGLCLLELCCEIRLSPYAMTLQFFVATKLLPLPTVLCIQQRAGISAVSVC